MAARGFFFFGGAIATSVKVQDILIALLIVTWVAKSELVDYWIFQP
jgi:hypothetical protein